MSSRRLVLAPVMGALSIWLTGCSSDPLNYETALNLMRDRSGDAVKITFSASPQLAQSDPKIKEAYDQLMEGHVLDCQPNAAVGTLCQPGPAGGGITQIGSTDLSVVAGRWVPSVITKINRSGSNGATAEARLTFEPSALYREYQAALDLIQNSSDGRVALAQQKDGRSAQATFVHAEDGWHLESMQ